MDLMKYSQLCRELEVWKARCGRIRPGSPEMYVAMVMSGTGECLTEIEEMEQELFGKVTL